ncbi:MAG: metallophosphoesterase [Gemmatimonadetes bacterium]|nr:metallophosphoesterase [Gemmatimonadota bacterium]
MTLRILLVADSHLGFDLPVSPRVKRRRRGEDFFANHETACQAAIEHGVDLVVHGGDVFDRPGVRAEVALRAYAPLRAVAERGIPVVVVPGNHEKSQLPHGHLLQHPRVHVFSQPRTVTMDVRGVRVALAGFPYVRRDVRSRMPELVEATRWRARDADLSFLCVHHCVEGATVGPGNYTFTTADDVIRHADVPAEFAAVLAGHIHRAQRLDADLQGRPLRTPVFYPGSVERTSLAEIDEPKGYLLLEVGAGQVRHTTLALPARPMVRVEMEVTGVPAERLDTQLQHAIASAPEDAVLVLRVSGNLAAEHQKLLAAARLRRLAPPTMNIEVRANWGPAYASANDREVEQLNLLEPR